MVEVEGCELHPWSPEGFMRCMSGRRLILIGDSLMRQTFHSLACMLGSVSTKGSSGLWDSSTSRILGMPASFLGFPFNSSCCAEDGRLEMSLTPWSAHALASVLLPNGAFGLLWVGCCVFHGAGRSMGEVVRLR